MSKRTQLQLGGRNTKSLSLSPLRTVDEYGKTCADDDLCSTSSLSSKEQVIFANHHNFRFICDYFVKYMRNNGDSSIADLENTGIIVNIHSFPPTKISGKLCDSALSTSIDLLKGNAFSAYRPTLKEILFYFFKSLYMAEPFLSFDVINLIMSSLIRMIIHSLRSYIHREEGIRYRNGFIRICLYDIVSLTTYKKDIELCKGWIDYRFIHLIPAVWFNELRPAYQQSQYKPDKRHIDILFHFMKDRLYQHPNYKEIVYPLMKRLIYLCNSYYFSFIPSRKMDSILYQESSLHDYHISILITMFCINFKFIITYDYVSVVDSYSSSQVGYRYSQKSYCLASYLSLADSYSFVLMIRENVLRNHDFTPENDQEFVTEINEFIYKFIQVWNSGIPITPFELLVSYDHITKHGHLILPEQFKHIIITTPSKLKLRIRSEFISLDCK